MNVYDEVFGTAYTTVYEGEVYVPSTSGDDGFFRNLHRGLHRSLFRTLFRYNILLFGLLAVGCVDKTPDNTPPAPIAPTVHSPAEAAPVDLEPVNRSVEPVREHNRQLRGELDLQKEINANLALQLDRVSQKLKVEPEEWVTLKQTAAELQASRNRLQILADGQAEAILDLETKLRLANTEVTAAEQERANLRISLKEANKRILEVHERSEQIARERESQREERAKAEGRLDTVKESLRKTRWWAIVATALIVIYIVLRVWIGTSGGGLALRAARYVR